MRYFESNSRVRRLFLLVATLTPLAFATAAPLGARMWLRFRPLPCEGMLLSEMGNQMERRGTRVPGHLPGHFNLRQLNGQCRNVASYFVAIGKFSLSPAFI